jgi:hypothetical protein
MGGWIFGGRGEDGRWIKCLRNCSKVEFDINVLIVPFLLPENLVRCLTPRSC